MWRWSVRQVVLQCRQKPDSFSEQVPHGAAVTAAAANWILSQKRSIEQAPICGFYFHSCFDLTINGM
jgi:hypothetical protein